MSCTFFVALEMFYVIGANVFAMAFHSVGKASSGETNSTKAMPVAWSVSAPITMWILWGNTLQPLILGLPGDYILLLLFT